MQTNPRTSANLPANTPRRAPRGLRGGAMGGAYPCGASSRPYSAPQRGGATGIRDPPSRTPLGAMGAIGTRAQGPWPPLCWGGDTRERLAGVHIYLGVPW